VSRLLALIVASALLGALMMGCGKNKAKGDASALTSTSEGQTQMKGNMMKGADMMKKAGK